jgi:predicted LPLAT superfamily acyltransferase
MATEQRGSGWSIGLVFKFYKIFGYKFIYILMYPVTFFYFLVASNVKKSLKIYYENIDMPFSNKVYFEHLRIFANCMVDRFITKLTNEEYSFAYNSKEKMTDILEQGCIVLHSHYGGWAAAANNDTKDVKNKINIVMQESLIDSIKKIEESKELENNLNIIDLNQGGIGVSIEVANALMNNEIVAIMGDRASNKKGEKEIDFFGKKANFNRNPFQIAYKTNKPILVYFVIFKSMKSYDVEYNKIELDKTLKEDESVAKAMKIYAGLYEDTIRKNPNQWFNFYNFWEKKWN